MNIREYKTSAERRKNLEKLSGVTLSNIGSFTLDESAASTRNCENMIGVAQIPMGVAGPLSVESVNIPKSRKVQYYIPLATTEGALVASVNRGCKAITASGGALAGSHRAGTTRGPVFSVRDLRHNRALYEFLRDNFSVLARIARGTSGHLTLQKISSKGTGKYRFVRFVYDTQDAMGMNMVTIATEKLVRHIEEKTGARCLALAGNFDTDKKPSWLNVVEQRGIKTWAEVVLPSEVVSGVLKTTAKKIFDVWLSKCMIGSAMSGSMAFNAQFANIVAALFAATGQDLGHVTEGSLGMTTAEVTGEDLYVSVYLPDLMVGTVGGGTGLATQKEALTLLGVAGGNGGANAETFARIVAAAVLAGEISLLASLAQGSLAEAHERLGRGGAV